jgi:hypothetical protein
MINNLRLPAAPLAAGALIAVVVAAQASAAPILPPTLSIYACAQGSGKTVAAGTPITLGTNWLAADRGLDPEAVRASAITIVVNGVQIANTGDAWTLAPTGDGGGSWNAEWRYSLGPAVTTLHIDVDWTFTHPVIDRVIFNPDGSPLVYRGMQFHGSCTLTVD